MRTISLFAVLLLVAAPMLVAQEVAYKVESLVNASPVLSRLPPVDQPHKLSADAGARAGRNSDRPSPVDPYAELDFPSVVSRLPTLDEPRDAHRPRRRMRWKAVRETLLYDPEGAGGYFGLSGAGSPFSFSAEIGLFGTNDNFSTRVSAVLLGSSSASNLYAGPGGGVRLSSPGVVSPFIGAGAFAGFSLGDWLSDSDTLPNSDEEDVDAFAAVYPEAGCHIWATRRTRLTLSAAYYVTTEGRDFDFWMSGVYWSFLTSPF